MGKKAKVECYFNDAFLNELHSAFELRRKAIRYALGGIGDGLLIEPHAAQLTVVGDSSPGPLITLVVRSGTADFEVRRSNKKQAGKVVLRLPGLRLIRNAARLVGAFEATVDQLGYTSLERIKAIWESLELTSV